MEMHEGLFEVKKISKQGKQKIVIIPKFSKLKVGDYVLIKKFKAGEDGRS